MANKIVKMIRSDQGDLVRVLSEDELEDIYTEAGVKFFPKYYEAPHDIWDLYEKDQETEGLSKNSRLSVADVKRFQQLIRRKNIDSNNRITVNKSKIPKPADIMEIADIIGLENKKEIQRFMAKLKRLQLIAESFDDKLDVVAYYVNPCFRKPGSRLSVELYGLFREYLFKAMTVKKRDMNTKSVNESELTSNTYRDTIEQVYQALRTTTSKGERAQEFVDEVTLEVVKEKLEKATTKSNKSSSSNVLTKEERANKPNIATIP